MVLAILFLFSVPATPDISALSLHVALPISADAAALAALFNSRWLTALARLVADPARGGFRRFNAHVVRGLPIPRSGSPRSEEHTSELQSRLHLVCRLLLEKKKTHTL